MYHCADSQCDCVVVVGRFHGQLSVTKSAQTKPYVIPESTKEMPKIPKVWSTDWRRLAQVRFIQGSVYTGRQHQCCDVVSEIARIKLLIFLMAYLNCRTPIQTRIPNPMGTLYYAEVFTLIRIQIQIPTQMVSRNVTVPIIGTNVCPKDTCPSQFYYISIRGSESKSEPMENFYIVQ